MSAIQSTTKKDYDVIIIGGGPAGLFAAHYLCEHSDLKVLIIDKGKGPLKRKCPITEKQKCMKCKPCNILCGIGGAGQAQKEAPAAAAPTTTATPGDYSD